MRNVMWEKSRWISTWLESVHPFLCTLRCAYKRATAITATLNDGDNERSTGPPRTPLTMWNWTVSWILVLACGAEEQLFVRHSAFSTSWYFSCSFPHESQCPQRGHTQRSFLIVTSYSPTATGPAPKFICIYTVKFHLYIQKNWWYWGLDVHSDGNRFYYFLVRKVGAAASCWKVTISNGRI